MKRASRIRLFTLAGIVCGVAGGVEARSAIRIHGRGVAYPSATLGASWLQYHRTAQGPTAGHSGRWQGYSGGGGIQCVTFARDDSGIELIGNANTWWQGAAGVYQRGTTPESGSVLNFRANRIMPMGHVAVVNEVVDGRTVVIDHANWGGPGAGRGRVSRGISVVDVSPDNDWSAVRVALGHSDAYGSIYPTYGFIYNRPDRGPMLASEAAGPAPAIPLMNPAPADLRPRDQAYDEVAEAPDGPGGTLVHRGWRRHRLALGVHRHGRIPHGN